MNDKNASLVNWKSKTYIFIAKKLSKNAKKLARIEPQGCWALGPEWEGPNKSLALVEDHSLCDYLLLAKNWGRPLCLWKESEDIAKQCLDLSIVLVILWNRDTRGTESLKIRLWIELWIGNWKMQDTSLAEDEGKGKEGWCIQVKLLVIEQ